MSDYIDRLEAIEKEKEDFQNLEWMLTKMSLPLTDLGLIVPKKVTPFTFTRTKENRLFGFHVDYEEGPLYGYAWEGFLNNVLIFFFVYHYEKASITCSTKQKGKKTTFEFYNALSPGRYVDLFTYVDEQVLKRSMGAAWNRIAEVLAEEQWG